MSNIPNFTLYEPSDIERERVREWLSLYNFDKKLMQSFVIESEEERSDNRNIQAEWNALTEFEKQLYRKKIASSVRNFEGVISIGDIRLLPYDLLADDTQPRYFAVLQEWDEGQVLIAPFSKFSVPAVQGEMETDHQHFSLKNLELWNAIIAPDFSIQKSWLADTLSQSEILCSLAVFRFISSGEQLDEKIKQRVGAPIFKDSDPRISYQNKETKMFEPLRERISDHTNQFSALFDLKVMNMNGALLAAADSDEGISSVGVFNDINHFITAMKSNEYPHKLSADNISFTTDKERLDCSWELDNTIPIDGSEPVFLVDTRKREIVGFAALSQQSDNPLISTYNLFNSIRKDLLPQELYIAIIKE